MDAHWRFGRIVPRAVVRTALAAPLVTLAGLALPARTASADAVTGSQRPPGFLSVQGELVAVTTISSSDA
jgi:hypothetical protein